MKFHKCSELSFLKIAKEVIYVIYFSFKKIIISKFQSGNSLSLEYCKFNTILF